MSKTYRVMTIVLFFLLACPLGRAPAASTPSLDELLDIQPKDREDVPGSGDPQAEGVPIDPAVQRKLSGQAAADAFRRAVAEMDEVSTRLSADQDPGLDTQRIQDSIVQKLDMVIAAAKKKSQSSTQDGEPQDPSNQDTGSEANAAKAQDGAASSGQASGGNPSGSLAADAQANAMRETRRQWGNLPPRVRSELLQGLREHVSPVYKTLTEAYYQTLAEQEAE